MDEMEKEEEEQHLVKKQAATIKKYGMTNVEPSHKNPSVDFSEMYNGLVQISDHTNDSDDLVPELNQEKPEPKKEEALP